ncbi:hypothetical protein SEA_ANNADREAMY_251 [Streptomyces phage Annadreamy]|uniref:Uncharacterized protein n=2 Tax=Annadreamyvirus annadreamy TaxID=2846392 RepID=A0A345GTQ8_9CAUD|nr:hypothetical protein HWB75_gp028 [Streptomyces phage Annadreamy]AXG66330.1 hypothetical protein SEA_ANNADREAMY_251 [Streptomyces phage Annadreamy]QGH79558.1 hypothetical protein SEA_LIMPID_257 [Streptomyces phage Limpid]
MALDAYPFERLVSTKELGKKAGIMTTAKTATTAKRAPRKTAAKAQTAVSAVSTDDPQNLAGWTWERPQGADTFVSTGKGPALGKLTPRALENLTELAQEGNTDSARRYWIRRLAQYGVTVPFVSVDASE